MASLMETPPRRFMRSSSNRAKVELYAAVQTSSSPSKNASVARDDCERMGLVPHARDRKVTIPDGSNKRDVGKRHHSVKQGTNSSREGRNQTTVRDGAKQTSVRGTGSVLTEKGAGRDARARAQEASRGVSRTGCALPTIPDDTVSMASTMSMVSAAAKCHRFNRSSTSLFNSYTNIPNCTAEEYLQSASRRMTSTQLRKCLKDPKSIYEEFWEIPMNHADKIEVAGSGMKNRYRTIIPNEHSRVKLAERKQDPLTGYINANYIRGYTSEPNVYIATQGPMSNTVNDFWRMVWQEKAPTIIMITKLREKSRTKCENYIPDHFGTYDDLDVHVNSVSEKEGYILRQLTIKYLNEEHKLFHYWYMAWPDHKAPSTARQLLHLVLEVERERVQESRSSKGPIIVHCSAGIGRTGCFIATSIGLQQLRTESEVDILSTVAQMRLDRGGMVQTNEQYEFVHQALSLYQENVEEESEISSDHS